MSTVTDSTSATFRAFQQAGVDPALAHEASEEVRNQAGLNIIAHVDARFDVIDARFDVIDARFKEIDARLDTLTTLINRDHLILLSIIATAVAGGMIRLFLF